MKYFERSANIFLCVVSACMNEMRFFETRPNEFRAEVFLAEM